MRYGVSPEGYHYYPAFPYTSYAGMSDQDIRDLKTYLFSLAPIARENQPHQLVWVRQGPFSATRLEMAQPSNHTL